MSTKQQATGSACACGGKPCLVSALSLANVRGVWGDEASLCTSKENVLLYVHSGWPHTTGRTFTVCVAPGWGHLTVAAGRPLTE